MFDLVFRRTSSLMVTAVAQWLKCCLQIGGTLVRLFGDTIDITNANLPRTAQTGTSE